MAVNKGGQRCRLVVGAGLGFDQFSDGYRAAPPDPAIQARSGLLLNAARNTFAGGELLRGSDPDELALVGIAGC